MLHEQFDFLYKIQPTTYSRQYFIEMEIRGQKLTGIDKKTAQDIRKLKKYGRETIQVFKSASIRIRI